MRRIVDILIDVQQGAIQPEAAADAIKGVMINAMNKAEARHEAMGVKRVMTKLLERVNEL